MDNRKLSETISRITRESREKFKREPWPSPVSEEWRRTSLAKYDLSGFVLQNYQNREEITSRKEELLSTDFDIHIIKASGKAADIRIKGDLDHKVTVFNPLSLEVGGIEIPDSAAILVTDAALRADNRTSYLALSSLDDSLFIIIPDSIILSKPILVEFEASPEGDLFLPNLFVNAGKGAEIKIIQKIKAPGGANVSGFLQVNCDSNSNVHLATVTEIENDSVLFLNRNFDLSEKAVLSDFQSYTGGTLVKSRTEVNLAGDKGEARLYGTVLSDENSHIDVMTVQHHIEKGCFSQAEIKSIVRDRGRSIYQGLIEVEEAASLTDAYLTNNNIVLNDGARADSIPSLKIRNNNVKCSHGSTTGKIDEDQIIYLTSRGLEREDAKDLILEGFLSRVYNQLSEPVSSYCSPIILDKLKQAEAVY